MRLLDDARAMNEDALTRIFDLYSRPIYNYALHLCHDPRLADEIVGDVFAKLLEQLSASRGPRTNLRSYLYAMAYHLVIDEARYSNRRDSLDAVGMHKYEGPAFEELENRLQFEKVMYAIQNTLTKDQRHVIVLRFLEGMSLRETALIVGKQLNHVKVLQNRAIQSLKKTLETGQ
jgi:RNA polymerase sigma-70 factor (ECF subfamily)